MSILITTLLPIIVTMSLGFFAGWHKDFNEDQSSILNRMVMLYALPMNLISGILSTERSVLLENLWLFVWLSIGMIGGYFLFLLVFRYFFKNSMGRAALRALSISGPAVPFVGTSVLSNIFGSGNAALSVSIASILMNVVQVPVTLLLLSSDSNNKTSFLKNIQTAIKKPVVWAPVISFILVLVNVHLPSNLKGTFTLLGTATGGVALFASGAILFSQKVSISKSIISNVLLKNVVVPLIIFAALVFFHSHETLTNVTTITMAIPTASIPVILSVQYKKCQKEMASTLFFSTLFSVISMGSFIYFLV